MQSITEPPVAAKRPHDITVHGHTRVDDYYWLRDREDPEVIAYLEAENRYTEAMTAHTKGLQERLYQEMVGRIQESDSSPPVKDGDFHYYTRTEKGKQYSIYCRTRIGTGVAEEVLLDLNHVAEEHEYVRLGLYEVSPDHRILAYSLDTDGAENYVIYFKNLETGEPLPDEISGVSYTAAWANDSRTLFYTTQDEAKRSYKCFRHQLGDDPGSAELLHHEQDRLFRVHLDKTKDRAFIVLNVQSFETTENYTLDADMPGGSFQLIHPREKGLRYFVDHHSGMFYMVTNDNATNFKLVTAPVINPGKSNWQELIPHRPQVKLDDVELFSDHMVIYERENGLRTLGIVRLADGHKHYVSFPEPVYTYRRSPNREFESKRVRFSYTSMTTSDSEIEYDMETRESSVIKQKPVLGGYDKADYLTERIFATADDGAQVPISLVYRKGLTKDGTSPCLLYGYGSYGANMDPSFDEKRLTLIDRGIIYAIAHIRGGEEMGRSWYEQGKFLHKKNSFNDFISCARHLIAAGYTSSDRLAISGRSAGGLLMGAVVNSAPELFKAVVVGVPFVDVVTTMLDESIPLTVGEFEEWGNPKEKDYYDYLLSYSPYDNTSAQAYPHMLVTAGLNDPRVQYWEPAKWTAKLRSLKKDHNTLLLKTFMGAGHFSSSGRYDYLKDVAFEYAFLLDVLDVAEA